MAIKDQISKLKENWLIVAVVLIAFIAFSGISDKISPSSIGSYSDSTEKQYASNSYERLSMTSSIVPGYSEGFAPETQERAITKSASISTEVERNEFQENSESIKSLIKQNNAILLNENVNEYESGRKSYLTGYYQIKIETSKYDSLVNELKNIGEIKSFSENADDITKRKVDAESTLEAEKERLARYNQMYNEAVSVSDKIELSDRIFNQERTIKYYEEELSNIDNQVSYSTISLTITEKQSDYANTIFVKFSDLVNSFLESLNNLLKFFVVILPWAVIAFILYLLYRRFGK